MNLINLADPAENQANQTARGDFDGSVVRADQVAGSR